MLDVDGGVGIDRVERLEEPHPELLAVAAPDGDELPGGVRGPPVQRVPAAEAERVLVGGDTPETVVENAEDAAVLLVDARVLGGRVVDEVTQALDRGDRVD